MYVGRIPIDRLQRQRGLIAASVALHWDHGLGTKPVDVAPRRRLRIDPAREPDYMLHTMPSKQKARPPTWGVGPKFRPIVLLRLQRPPHRTRAFQIQKSRTTPPRQPLMTYGRGRKPQLRVADTSSEWLFSTAVCCRAYSSTSVSPFKGASRNRARRSLYFVFVAKKTRIARLNGPSTMNSPNRFSKYGHAFVRCPCRLL